MKISKLPNCTFLGTGSRQELVLSACGPKIHWLADLIRKKYPTERRIGINFPTSPQLILTWLAALMAGKEPCLLHSPTEKISKDYWRESIKHTLADCGLQGLIHGENLTPHHPELLAKSLLIPEEIGEIAGGSDDFPAIAVIQLSSGTTGHKKGVRLTGNQLRQHVENYNHVMRLGQDDVIISWLPLYHDMGFIACFVMPLILNVPIVMIDSMAWVKRPEMLFEAVEQYRGTVCYMPNFGFEIMSRQRVTCPLKTMRHWISCSEPTYAATLSQFCEKHNVSPSNISTCYAMAENVFAVSQSQGVKTVQYQGESLVSCGKTIPGTQVKLVNDQIYVKSDTSLSAYVGHDDVRDADGFYATGDLGLIIDGEIYISGRKRDMMISGGRKYFLNDLDFTAGKILPTSAGRIAALAEHNKHLGTETLVILIERPNFWDKRDLALIADAIKRATDLEALEIHFVPPRFITKTSSGKINRKKTLEDWRIHQASKAGLVERAPDENRYSLLATQITESFPSLAGDRPLETELDSLGSMLMRLICESHGVAYDAALTVETLLMAPSESTSPNSGKVFSIVALVDGVKLGFGGSCGFITEDFIARVSRAVGSPVRVEHLTVPPASVLFSDIIFHDYFMQRDGLDKYSPFSAVIRKIKDASLILVDDEDAFRLRQYCAYPRLSHRFNHEPEAKLLGHRLQTYTLNHHLLPREVVTGRDIDPASITETIDNMAAYLDVPVMKIAFHQEFISYTEKWDYTQYRRYVSDVDYQNNPVRSDEIQEAISTYIHANRTRLKYKHGIGASGLLMNDLPHFCSFLFNSEAVDYVLKQYQRFCIAGLPSSIPYLEQQLKKLEKPFFYSTSLSPERTDYDCMLCTGFHGRGPATIPHFDFVHIGDEGGGPHNVAPGVAEACPSLAAGDQALTRIYRKHTGNVVPIGNYVLNQEAEIRRFVAAPLPSRKSSKRTPVGPPAVAKLGELTKAEELFRKKSPRAAWDAAREAICLRPHHPEAFLLLAEIARLVGDSASARSCAQHALALAPAFKPAKKFLKSSFTGNTKLEWMVLPQSIERRAKKIKPTLSVCLIVKNEERFIRQCLASVKDFADQIVVVDTGSTDRTVAIAREFGAEIHEFKWCNDFSAARNAALQHVTGDWVLSFDADEELPAENRAAFLRLLEDESVISWRLPIVDIGRENEGCNYVPRLFRNAPGLHFVGRVHEQVFYSVEAHRIEWGLENRIGDAALRHHGYTKELIKERGKIERNLRLLERAIEEMPDDPLLQMNYGLELCRSERVEDGVQHYQIAFDTMSALPPSAVTPETREALLTQYCTYLRVAKRPAEVLPVLTSPLARQGELTASQHFLLGLAHMELEQFAPAAQQMRLCLEKRSKRNFTPINADILTVIPQHSIALCLWQTKDIEGADQAFQAAIAEAPAAPKVQIDYARFLHEHDKTVDALQLLNQLASADPAVVGVWTAGGQIALGQPALLEVAVDWTAVAINHHPDDAAVLAQRAESLMLAGQLQEALPLWEKLAHDAKPRVLAARILCEVALSADASVPSSFLTQAVSKEFVRWYWRLVEFGAEPTVLQLHAGVDALKQVLPDAAELVHSIIAKLAVAETV